MIVANWKMNGSKDSIETWLRSVSSVIEFKEERPCIFFPPSCFLDFSNSILKEISSSISLGSQTVNFSEDSPLTGGIDIKMLKEFNSEYVLIGHSEQRDYFKEDNNLLKLKIKTAINEDISPIFCVGEPKKIKHNNQTKDFLINQLQILNKKILSHITIAYEPIWAIGTGDNASLDYIEHIHAFIKDYCHSELGFKEKVSVVYGGSVKLNNCEEILSSSNVDGLLIGGASLDPDTFSKIYNLS